MHRVYFIHFSYDLILVHYYIQLFNNNLLSKENTGKSPVEAPRNPNNGQELPSSSSTTTTTPIPPPLLPARLIDHDASPGAPPHKGTLQIYYNGRWSHVCGDDGAWDELASYVTCRQLGFAGVVSMTLKHHPHPVEVDEARPKAAGPGRLTTSHKAGQPPPPSPPAGLPSVAPGGGIELVDLRCDGTESGLHQCTHKSLLLENQCLSREVVHLECARTIEGECK